MRLLIVSHVFPPSPHPNGKRPYYVAKGALEAGWEVDVIATSAWVPEGRAETLVHDRLRIRRRSHPLLDLLKRVARWPRLERVIRLACNGLIWPDFFAPWARRVFRDARDFAGYDRVLAFVNPASVLLAGRRDGVVSSRWTFDLQESVSPFLKTVPRGSPLQRLWTPKLERLERRTLHAVGRVIFTADSNRHAYIRGGMVPERRAEHVPYFYDAPVFARASVVDPGFEIRYYGNFDLHGDRNPETFLKSLAMFLERHPEARRTTRFVFHGNWVAAHGRFLEGLGLEDVTEIRSALPYEEYLEGLQRSPMLLLVVAAAHNLFMPSKIVDYFGAERPILGFVPGGSEMGKVLHQAGMADYTVADRDVEGGCGALERLWELHQRAKLEVAADKVRFWSSETQIPRYLQLLKSRSGDDDTGEPRTE
jgi:glycosyltransferase involved in cell wall biosynthesis